ncbi:MAG: CvpA family protein [Halanaerobiales bacterium]|nr:CvpA family protein [Halanaerobiales bacterium]
MREIVLIDLGIILFIIFFTFRGYQQGLIRQTIALIGLILGLRLAMDNHQYIATWLQAQFYIPNAISTIIGFALILFIVILVINIIGWIMSGLAKLIFLSFFDRLIGAVLGLVKGVIVVYLILLLISKVPYQQISNQLERSVLAKEMLDLTPYIEENIERIIHP